jgi:hypothetical protein
MVDDNVSFIRVLCVVLERLIMMVVVVGGGHLVVCGENDDGKYPKNERDQ